MKLYALLCIVALLAPLSAAAQTSESTTISTPRPSPPTELPPTETSLITKSEAPLVWLRFRRFLTRDSIKDTELTLAITNRLALDMQLQPTKTGTLLEQYERENELLNNLSATIAPYVDDAATSAFLSQLLNDKTTQISLLEHVKPQTSSELARKIVNARAKALREIVKILENDNLTTELREIKLAEVAAKYSEKERSIDAKLVKKLALKEELDDESEDEDMEDALGHEEDEIIDEAAEALEKDELTDFIAELQRKEGEGSLVVLQKLLAFAPEAKKGGIETAIDAVVAKHIDTFRQDPASIETFLADHSGSQKVRDILLERIKEQAKDETLKQKIEKVKETTQKAEEAQREQKKKQEELKKEQDKKAQESTKKKESSKPVETKTPESQETTKSTESPKSEATTVEVKIKEDGRPEKTSFTVKKNSLLTVKIESEYEGSVTVSLSGVGSKTITKDQKQSFSPFTITETTSVTINGVGGTISVQ